MKSEKDAINWLKVQKLPFWRVCLTDSKTVVARSQEQEENQNLQVEESARYLEETLQTLSDGLYVLIARRTDKGFNGEQAYPFQIANEPPGPGPGQIIAGVGNQFNSDIAELKLQLVKMELERKYEKEKEDLKRQIEKLKNDPFDKLQATIGMLASLTQKSAPPKIQGLESQKNGPESEPAAPMGEHDQLAQEISQALERLNSHFKGPEEFLQACNKLADLADNSPTYFKQLIKSLP